MTGPGSGAGMPGGPIRWMAERSIAANLLMLILIGGGIWTAIHVQKEVLPEFQLDVVEVSVSYPGAAPAEVEQGILLPIESATRGVSGIRDVTSTAREGGGTVVIQLVSGTDRMQAFGDIDQAVSRIRTFPEDIEEPEVRLSTQQRSVLRVELFGDIDAWRLRGLAEQLRDELLTDGRITQVEVARVPDYVTHVEIRDETLREYGLTLEGVARLIEASSRDVPAGSVEASEHEILLRMRERKLWADEFAQIPIKTTEAGAALTLGDIASIRDGFEEIGFHSQFNRKLAVSLRVYRVGEQSPLDVADAVDEVMARFAPTLPEGVTHRIDGNRAQEYEDRLSLLLDNGWMAILIVLFILGLFLEIRLAFWVMMGMVVSFVGAMILLPVIDVSVNMISMFGFLVALGIVVDDAIVVGENVAEHRERGMEPMVAAVRGTRDIAWPVTFAVLSTIVTFVPVLFIPGTTGKFWSPLPAIVILVLLVSLIEVFLILPAHLAHARLKARTVVGQALHDAQQAFMRGFLRLVDKVYRPTLELTLRFRYVTLAFAFTTLAIVGSFALSDHIGMIMMPEVAADEIEAGVRLPVGTTREQAAGVAEAVTLATERMFVEHDLHEVAEGIKTNVRRGGSFIDVEIVMKPPEERDMTAAQVIALWRDEIGDLEGVHQVTFEAERGPGGWRDDISVDLSHSDIAVLERASQLFVERMEAFEATRDVNDNYNKGKAQFDFELLPEAYALGLDATEIGRQVRAAFFGAVAKRQLRGTNEVEVRVKLPEEDRRSLHTLEQLVIRTPSGVEVPLMDVAKVTDGEAFTSINRRNGRRIVSVGMDVEPQSATSRVLSAIQEDVLPQLRAELPGLTWTFEGSQAEMRKSTTVLWGGFALALLIMYALLAVAFGSYIQPLIVMSAIPFGIVGAVIGHLLLGHDLSLISLMGVIALSGVVVNDSLIMLDYANKKRRAGLGAFEAIHEAGVRRFRPIILTTLTTFGGLTPIIFEESLQAQYLIPMAISLGFGIVFATAIILVIVPCLYMVVEDVKRLFGVAGKGSVPEGAPELG